jgi:GT2 family glycosyltransferase
VIPVPSRHPEGATAARVSIVIPFRDQPRFLRTCLDSVRATTEDNPEFILIDNGSSEPETKSLLERVGAQPRVHVVPDPGPFNWARLSNAGAGLAAGEVLLFMNNDIEAVRPGWLSALVAHALREDVGAVGARLLYADRRLQHCGIVVGLNGAAGHPLVGLDESEPGYLDMATATRECSAVTGACLATRKTVFDRLGGFDETLGVDLNDVDFCLRAWNEGYRVVYEPEAELLHHESPSRGTAGATGDIVRFVERWGDYISAGDRYFNRHLTRQDPSCGLAGPDEKEQWIQWFSTVAEP